MYSGRDSSAEPVCVGKGRGVMARIGETIRNLRERMGVSQDTLAEWVGVSRATVAQIELGRRSPESLELFRMADFFGCTVSDLMENEPETLAPVGVRFRRALGVDRDSAIWETVARCMRLARETEGLRRMLDIGRSEDCLPGYRLPGPSGKPEAIRQGYGVAREERSRLKLGTDRIENMGELLESQGVFAGQMDMPRNVSGFTLNIDGVGIICMANVRHSGLRRRFSMAHEYGHALMDSAHGAIVSKSEDRDELLEVRANVFAAAFLMPEQGMLEMIRRIGKGAPTREQTDVYDEQEATRVERRQSASDQEIQLYDAARLAFYFGVSIQAVLYRLKNLRVIGQSRLEKLLDEESTEEGAHLRRVMHIHDDDRRLEEPDLLRNTVLNMALEALRRELISRGKCLEIAGLACDRQKLGDLEILVDSIAPRTGSVSIPDED